ncbi:MAG: hypothetical protein J2P31_13295, partial [Blastocatellia bacterium]|nr:hypothetical protein [Blastocatellia bacterium]
MCGIVGYVGDQQVVPIVIEGLRRLEYRGYDSAGIAVVKDGNIQVRRRPGKLNGLVMALKDEPLDGEIGLGHCLAPDTLIQLADGRVLPIERLEGEVKVISLDRATMRLVPRTARVFRHRSPEKLIELRTAAAGITCTREHRMLVMNPKTGEIEDRFAGDIQIGDLLILAKRIPAPEVAEPISFTEVQPRRYWALTTNDTAALQIALTMSGLNQT